MTPSRLINRNVTSLRGRTSMRLEPELWDALEELCHREHLPLGDVVKMVEERGHPGGRTSAVRVFILTYYRTATTEAGHQAAAHGRLEGGMLRRRPAEGAGAGWRAGQSAREVSVAI